MNNADDRKSIGGFTLLEMMIVVAIIGILAAVSIPAYYNHMMRSRQSIAINELMSIKAAEQIYYADNGGYTTLINQLDGYTAAGTNFVNGPYAFWLTSDSVMALGDLNGDGTPLDGWQVSIDDLTAKPETYDTGGNEGFSWSSLGKLF